MNVKTRRAQRFWMTAGYLLLGTSLTSAQGMLPGMAVSTTTAHEVWHPLLIGDRVPESLILVDENGKRRTLLSYKSGIDILVVAFFSEPCDTEKPLWPLFRRIAADYKGWRVAFVAVSTEPGQEPMRLPDRLLHEKIHWPVLHDGQKIAADLFKITATPEIAIVDEFAIVRYRGPLSGVRQALDRIIGHTDDVKEPDLPIIGGCSL